MNPNGIQHISAFVVLCEGYLGIEPHFELWKYFFAIELQMKERKKLDLVVPNGMCEHPSSRQLVIRVHVHPVVKVQQGVA